VHSSCVFSFHNGLTRAHVVINAEMAQNEESAPGVEEPKGWLESL